MSRELSDPYGESACFAGLQFQLLDGCLMMLCPSLPEKIEIARIYGVEDDRYVAKKFGRLSWAFFGDKKDGAIHVRSFW